MYCPREKVFWFATTTRLLIILLQILFNIICPDHNADAFRSPRNPRENNSVFDNMVTLLFGGLVRWDAEYFIHIAKYGFTHEETLVFFPLYPMTIWCIAIVLRVALFIFNDHSVIVLTAVFINFVCFVRSAVTLYDLSIVVLKNTNIAYKAAILYCLNPASIFFTAVYSESMFAYLTFRSMLAIVENDPYVFLPLSMSTLTRSNGLCNIGFSAYEFLKNLINTAIPNFYSEYRYYPSKWSLIFSLRHILINLCQFMTVFILSLIPLFLFHVNNYTKFCTPLANVTDLAPHVVHYAIKNNLILPGNSQVPWCDSNIPVSYSYIQNKYWNVGFLRYYQVKQIPNFVLAFPMLYIILNFSIRFLRKHRKQLPSLGLFKKTDQNEKTAKGGYPIEMFPFVIHGLFLSCFCILLVHIQVSTRLLSSASPLIYWYCAFALSYKRSANFENLNNLFSKWKVFLFTQERHSVNDILILVYFVGYIVVGTFMYSNFLPWT
ncbi:GPI mannosyltransferase 2 isoform X1 [Belonocnema kinseyi]|uniref:GPI mannosyltransferase 2 isoform X1 n=1 Tax=Belonocnema kinseyi TaxID=2817044 RepID=UPI00143DC47F|nr:GPI mannosyltransferase 2 isoform X1 [Belonocnema kinseyi]XP_033231908.1 GPI mannosyltransferase 2 isoform X1 [Belonocnema kinseyi]XP_033231969.1 GPI mannosyltransferase 2 isoform X1 [Belonocnema kinseyi]XP_033232034.1 GPI mannosyltransferase 2 isoform X1 [Belonocnema kinseyi]